MSVAAKLDGATESDARAMLERCCGSRAWVSAMMARRPFASDAEVLRAADQAWSKVGREDILEALAHHPRIGANLDELRKKYASTASWAAGEQAGAASADEATLVALRDGNVRYEAKFGHIFVVCATGKSAKEMLSLLEARMDNDAVTELGIAAAEQHKITRLRLEKLA